MLAPKPAVARLALIASVLLCCSLDTILAQENTQLQIPPSLVECYNTSYFMNRDNRLPATMETLITIIEKVENSYGYQQDIYKLTSSLLYRFRQDGIQRARNVNPAPGVIPYSPHGIQFPKFKILLSRLISGDAMQFPNNSLTAQERCSMHFMLSSSIDKHVRGDEGQVCNQLSQYRSQRIPRSARNDYENNFLGDVEILENNQRKRGVAQNILQQRNSGGGKSYNVEFGYGQTEYVPTNDNSVSQCPVENGVVWTPWGTVSPGAVLAGIATGLQQQWIPLRTLLMLSSRPNVQSLPQTATVRIDNRWAATLAGDLAEVALVQVPTTNGNTATVGANGGWNNTVMNHWYFLSQRQYLEMTDAEIRGGLDGLILSMNVSNWRTQVSNLKLSQLLRMYYSMDGVLSSGVMACNRKTNFGNIPIDEMIAQTSAFAQVLDREMNLKVTLQPPAIAQFAQTAAQALAAYVPSNLNDVSCQVSNTPQELSNSIRAMTNIYVFLDTSWQYKNVVNYVIYILTHLNINPYASQVTLLAANDASIIVNTTNILDDVYANWNVTSHSTFMPGFNLPKILTTIQNLTQNYMNAQRTNSSVGGHSLVALLIPYMASINEADSSFSVTQLQYLSEQVPDLKFVYYAGGQTTRFTSFVQDPSQDLYPLSVGQTPAVSSGPVVSRIKKIPRRIINPRCGSNWYTNSWGTDQMYQYASPGYINFYRMVPNYFFGSGSGRQINIQSQGPIQFTVCTSRTILLPQQNSTNQNFNGASTDQNCVQLSGNTFTYDLSSACNGYHTIHNCPPLYLSVQAPAASNGNPQTVSCNDAACQTPDQARYTVSVVNMGCYSGVAQIAASFLTIAMAYFLRQLLV